MYKYYFNCASNGIYNVAKNLAISINDEVLVPAWICEEALQAYRLIGCKILFYKTDANTLNVDLNDLISKLSINTKLIHVVNNFGFIQNWNELLPSLSRYKIKILEDNAYALSQNYKTTKLGSFGDYAVFSFRKTLPIRNGAVLFSKSELLIKKNKVLYYNGEINRFLYLFVDIIGLKYGEKLRNVLFPSNNIPKYNFPIYSSDGISYPNIQRGMPTAEFKSNPEMPLSLLTKVYLNIYLALILFKFTAHKQYVYDLVINNILEKKSIKILKLGANFKVTTPYCVMLIVDTNRDQLFNDLYSAGFPVFVWPNLPLEVLNHISEYPDVEHLGKKLIQLDLKFQSIRIYKKFIKYINNLD